MIKKYNINIPESEINDLKDRINNTRWPNDPFNEDWVNGTNKDFLKDFLNYWANDYNWRKAESKINELEISLNESVKRASPAKIAVDSPYAICNVGFPRLIESLSIEGKSS